MNLEGSFLLLGLLGVAVLLMPGVSLLASLLQRVTGCQGDLANLFALLVIPMVFLGGSLYLDARGSVVPGRVTAKSERIHYGHEGSWNRTLSAGVEIPEPEGSRLATPLSVGLSPAEYDRLRVGGRVDLRVLRVGRYFRFGRPADQKTWAAIPWQVVRFFGLLWGGVFLLCLWRPAGRRAPAPLSGARRQCLWLGIGVWLGVLALPLLRPAPAPAGRSLDATATVRQTERVTTLWQSRHSSGIKALQPFEVVELEFVPAGRNEPVLAVDKIDAGSVTGLEQGRRVAITYPANEPRAALIAGARRTHAWKNQLILLYGLRDVCVALVLVGVFVLLPLHLRSGGSSSGSSSWRSAAYRRAVTRRQPSRTRAPSRRL